VHPFGCCSRSAFVSLGRSWLPSSYTRRLSACRVSPLGGDSTPRSFFRRRNFFCSGSGGPITPQLEDRHNRWCTPLPLRGQVSGMYWELCVAVRYLAWGCWPLYRWCRRIEPSAVGGAVKGLLATTKGVQRSSLQTMECTR